MQKTVQQAVAESHAAIHVAEYETNPAGFKVTTSSPLSHLFFTSFFAFVYHLLCFVIVGNCQFDSCIQIPPIRSTDEAILKLKALIRVCTLLFIYLYHIYIIFLSYLLFILYLFVYFIYYYYI